jgi:hypothetical protein
VTNDSSSKPRGVNKAAFDSIPIGGTKAMAIDILGEPDSKSESEIAGFGTTEMWTWTAGSWGKIRGVTLAIQNGVISDKHWTDL